jgi:glutathione transport system substrate-binding protein
MNTQQKPFDNPKVREAINYAINKEALVKVAFSGYAIPAEGVRAARRGIRGQAGPLALQPGQGARAAEGSRLPERLRVHAVVGLQPHHGAEGDPVRAAAAGPGGHQGAGAGAGSRPARRAVESAQDPATAPVRMYYVGWSSSTGEADWALRPLLASEVVQPPKLFNTAYYKNPVDADIAKALVTTDSPRRPSSMPTRSSASGRTRPGPSW